MAHKLSDFDPQRQVQAKLAELTETNAALHAKLDQTNEHLATIASAVKAGGEANPQPSPSSPAEADKSG